MLERSRTGALIWEVLSYERRAARISLNSNFELRHSCFVYLFVCLLCFICFVFFVVVVGAGTYYFLRLGCPLPTEKIVGFPEVFVGYQLSPYVFSET